LPFEFLLFNSIDLPPFLVLDPIGNNTSSE
jgi:hypothetical protein